MATYALWQGTRTGVRVVNEETGETVTASGRLFDNMSRAAAEEAINLLERLDEQRRERIAGAIERNDIAEILNAAHEKEDNDRK